jgi:hypothetical protein
VQIALLERDKQRTDPFTTAASKTPGRALTGPIWSKVFIGGAGDPILMVDSASLSSGIEWMGYVVRYRYEVSATLTCNGFELPITAKAALATGGLHFDETLKNAVELGVIDTAKQASILSRDICTPKRTN